MSWYKPSTWFQGKVDEQLKNARDMLKFADLAVALNTSSDEQLLSKRYIAKKENAVLICDMVNKLFNKYDQEYNNKLRQAIFMNIKDVIELDEGVVGKDNLCSLIDLSVVYPNEFSQEFGPLAEKIFARSDSVVKCYPILDEKIDNEWYAIA